MPEKRHFTILKNNKEHGLFVGKSPSSVAKKVVSKLSNGNKVTFQLREITQGSKKKIYGPYEGIKNKLKKPIIVGDRVYKYESTVKKIKTKGGSQYIEIDFENYKILIQKMNERYYLTITHTDKPNKIYTSEFNKASDLLNNIHSFFLSKNIDPDKLVSDILCKIQSKFNDEIHTSELGNLKNELKKYTTYKEGFFSTRKNKCSQKN